MKSHTAKAEVPLRRQRTQYSCMSASMSACLNALGHTCTEDEVNEVMGARPMKGAAWEQALACAQHYGVRGTLVCPSTVPQLRTWTDAGKPVMIAWNPEGREWSHASVVFDVTDELPSPVPPECTVTGESGPWVWVADSNIPNPEKTVRIVCADVFYSKWFEKWPNYLVRRPALMLDREITPEGRQVMASIKKTAEPYDCWKDGLRGRELAECYMQFENDLGPEDIALVKRYFPNWSPSGGGYSPRYPVRAPVPKTALPADYPDRAKKLYAVLYALNDSVSLKFVRDNLYKSELSEKQIKWFESLEKKHANLLRKMPDNIHLQFVNNSPVIGISSAAEKEKLEKVLTLRLFRGHEYYISGIAESTPEPVVPSASPAAVPPSTGDRVQFDSERMQKMLPLLERLSKFSGMFAGFKRDLETGKGLTENQLKAIRQQLYKSGMRAEADNFRVASAQRVVAMHLAKSPSQVVAPKDRNREIHKDPTKDRDRGAIGLIERGGAGAGTHKNKQDFDRGHARAPKHKGRGYEEGMEETTKLSRKSE